MTQADAPPPETPTPATTTEPTQPYQAAARSSKLGYVSFAGLLALLAGLVWRAVEDKTGVVTDVWIFASLLAMLVPPAWHSQDLARAVASRRGAAFGFVVLTLGLGLVVAFFVGWADVELNKWSVLPSVDLTRTSRYSLSEESSRVMDKVEGTVYATYFVEAQSGTNPGLRARVVEQLRTFERASSHVRVNEVDAQRNPDAAAKALQEQGATTPSSGEDTDVVVLTYAEPGKEPAPGKQKEVKVEEWTFSKRSSTDEMKWLGEGVITGAIYELVFQKYKAYVTGGHGERPLAQDFHRAMEMLKSQNIDVVAEPLLLASKPQIPDDCEILFVLSPTAPFTPDEASLLSRWLDKGRTLFLTVDVQNDRKSTGLDAILEKFGVHTMMNYEVVAPQLQQMTINDRNMLVQRGMGSDFAVQGPAYGDHPATRALRARSGLATFFFSSTFIDVDSRPPEGADPQVVCYAPEAGQAMPVALRHDPSRTKYDQINPDTDKTEGKMPLVVTSTMKAKDGAPHQPRLVLSGDTDVFTDRIVEQHAPNLDLARGLVQWGLGREGLVAVSDRTLEEPFVDTTEYQRRFALWWPALVCLLPLIAGGMVWWARRR